MHCLNNQVELNLGGTGDETGLKVTASGDVNATLQQLESALKADFQDEKGNLSVDISNGVLTINGQKQPDEVLKKYEGLLQEKKDINFSIKIEDK